LSRFFCRHERFTPCSRNFGRAGNLEFTPKAELTQRMGVHQYRAQQILYGSSTCGAEGKAWSRSFWIARRERRTAGNAEADQQSATLAKWRAMRRMLLIRL
jgi:hypothetical protein